MGFDWVRVPVEALHEVEVPARGKRSPFLQRVLYCPTTPPPPRPVTLTSHGPLSALGLPEALRLVAFGGLEKSEEIPQAPVGPGLRVSP